LLNAAETDSYSFEPLIASGNKRNRQYRTLTAITVYLLTKIRNTLSFQMCSFMRLWFSTCQSKTIAKPVKKDKDEKKETGTDLWQKKLLQNEITSKKP
jgi:hypothetical protein